MSQENPDPSLEERKKDHIEMALKSKQGFVDQRFYYEPIIAAHPTISNMELRFMGTQFQLPLWISSMTGGTKLAKQININLAKACKEFGIGMGLGSCRSLLYNDERIEDFDVRGYMGDRPLYANLGIAQLEQLITDGATKKIVELIEKLQSDGLIIHVNPLQEWLQREGDFISKPPIDTIKRIIDIIDAPIIVKEVGQGMGLRSLEELFKLPLEAVEFAAHGGTNFSKLEMMRSENVHQLTPLATVGHTAVEMVDISNSLVDQLGSQILCKQIIISGGVRNFIDGYYLIKKSKQVAIYGQAFAFLEYAKGDYVDLQAFIKNQQEGLALSHSFLHLKED